MDKDTPLYNLPDTVNNSLMLLFAATQHKTIETAIEMESETNEDKMLLLEVLGVFWKGYSMGVADAMRVLDNADAVTCIQQADEHISELTNELKVQSFLDELDEYERGGDVNG
jgi:chromosome condensin MukBEF complex kleisin-like MukF subunit